jgi:hypothetical protein
MALSPDGAALVFVATDASERRSLWVRRLDDPVAKPILAGKQFGEAVIGYPFWSPDSRHIAYFTASGLARVPAAGGTPQLICYTRSIEGGSWGRNGTILLGSFGSAIYAVSDAGGEPKPVTVLQTEPPEVGHVWPQFLPDGEHFLYLAKGKGGGVYVQKLGTTWRKRLLASNMRGIHVAPGYLMFHNSSALTAQRFDAKRMELSGGTTVIADVGINSISGRSAVSFSEIGSMTYRARPATRSRLVSCTRTGECSPFGDPAEFTQMFLSPDGGVLGTMVITNYRSNIWFQTLPSGVPVRAGFSADQGQADVAWSPDSRRFASRVADLWDTGSLQIAGPAGLERTVRTETQPADAQWVDQWTPDGKYLLTHAPNAVYRISVDGATAPERLARIPTVDQVQLSPDGRWIAFNVGNERKTYIATYPSFAGARPVTAGRACQPLWRGDGRELYYLDPESRHMMAVSVHATGIPEWETPKRLFRINFDVNCEWSQYAVTRDGQRFYTFVEESRIPSDDLTVVLNWPRLLKE